MNKRERGAWGEDRAVAFLAEKGYTVIVRNFRSVWGEIDIIAAADERVVFVEVKVLDARAREDLGRIVGGRKQGRIRRAAEDFMSRRPELADRRLRCDVIAVEPGTGGITHVEDAF